jgi:repressor of nif and glnA expression
MKHDPNYIRKLLIAFQDAPEPTRDIKELAARGLSYETRELYFHLRLLNDQGFVERDDGEQDLGVDSLLDGNYSRSVNSATSDVLRTRVRRSA